MEYFSGWYMCKEPFIPVESDLDWCRNQFGESNWNSRWFYESKTGWYYFKNRSDAMWFTLRWL